MKIEEKLSLYQDLLVKWGQKINLVSKTTLDDIQTRHFDDSMQLTPYIPSTDATIVDIGTGAGFPGMVLAMLGYNVSLVEIDQKKCVFLENVANLTQTNVAVFSNRIENHTEKYDVITSRAVAPLKQLLIWSKALAHSKSIGLFLKGENYQDEIDALGEDTYNMELIDSKTNPKAKIVKVYFEE